VARIKVYSNEKNKDIGTSRPVTGGVTIISGNLEDTGVSFLSDDISVSFDATIHVQVYSQFSATVDAADWGKQVVMLMEILEANTAIRSASSSFAIENSDTLRNFTFLINTITSISSGDYTLRWTFSKDGVPTTDYDLEVGYVLTLKASDSTELMSS
jgi:Cu2+-containing amine oxidase